MEKIIIHCDGGSRGNPGEAAIGVVIFDSEHNVLLKYHERIGKATNNIAEYKSLIKALELAKKYKPKELHIFMDSELVIKQLNGEYKVKQEHLAELNSKVKELEKEYEFILYNNVKREDNYQKMADLLVNQALG